MKYKRYIVLCQGFDRRIWQVCSKTANLQCIDGRSQRGGVFPGNVCHNMCGLLLSWNRTSEKGWTEVSKDWAIVERIIQVASTTQWRSLCLLSERGSSLRCTKDRVLRWYVAFISGGGSTSTRTVIFRPAAREHSMRENAFFFKHPLFAQPR